MNKRTKKKYLELYDEPDSLFARVTTTIYPNGKNEISFKNDEGMGFTIVVSNGPHGLSLQVSRFVGGLPLTVLGNLHPDYKVSDLTDFEDVAICQYRTDPKSQAFRQWVENKGPLPQHMAPYKEPEE